MFLHYMEHGHHLHITVKRFPKAHVHSCFRRLLLKSKVIFMFLCVETDEHTIGLSLSGSWDCCANTNMWPYLLKMRGCFYFGGIGCCFLIDSNNIDRKYGDREMGFAAFIKGTVEFKVSNFTPRSPRYPEKFSKKIF